MIASSPTDIDPVLRVVAENAARLCDSSDAQIYRVEGDMARKVATYGATSPVLAVGESRPIGRGSASGRAIFDRQPVVIQYSQSEAGMDQVLIANSIRQGINTALAVPLLREGIAIGSIVIRRMELRPFTDEQIALLKTFADQAVIAIENVRLFQELTEALEQQTATSQILGVIASSPTDIQPVLDVVAENAARLCDATDAQIQRVEGDFLRTVASYGSMSAPGREERWLINPGHAPSRAVIDRQTIHIHDLAAEVDTKFPESRAFKSVLGLGLCFARHCCVRACLLD